MSSVTEADIQILATLARFYVLTREQIQQLCASHLVSGRSTRRRLSKLRLAGYIRKHRIPVALPERNGAAPVYYLTQNGAELLASYFDDEAYLATNTRHPRPDRLNHWIAVNDTRMVIERAIALQAEVTLDAWINEWQTIIDHRMRDESRLDNERPAFYLQTKLSDHPPLSCSPDAGFLLSLHGHKKVFYLEQDLGTSSPKQVAARKTKGYAELAKRKLHRKHFPGATIDTFGVLLVTTTAYRSRTIAERLNSHPRPDLWLCIDQHDLTPESFLHEPIVLNHRGERASLVRPTEDKNQEQGSA